MNATTRFVFVFIHPHHIKNLVFLHEFHNVIINKDHFHSVFDWNTYHSTSCLCLICVPWIQTQIVHMNVDIQQSHVQWIVNWYTNKLQRCFCVLCLSSDAGTVKNNKRPKHRNPICVSDRLSHSCLCLSAEHPVLQCLSLEVERVECLTIWKSSSRCQKRAK